MVGDDAEIGPFATAYPALARWVAEHGWIEIGSDGFSPSAVRVLNQAGLILDGGHDSEPVDDTLRSAEAALAQWLREEYGL